VKIAGVKVGSIKDLDVTERQTASVLIEITEPGFGDWRADAECSIRPQSLIGEKFVECTPTRPRPQGAKAPPLLKTTERDGQTVAVLPVDRTRRPIDLDLVNNTLRLPYRERLTLILNEFGAGVAGRGEDLNTIIRTADPSLKATDEVLELLADQNEVLRKLATDSDASLAPLARDRERVASFITQARKVSDATAERSTDLERNIERLPRFLRELRPTMQRLGALSDQGTPLLRDLDTVGPDLSRFVSELGPFSTSATTSLTSLGDAVGRRPRGAGQEPPDRPRPEELRGLEQGPVA
jgi:ABC-type transporter Mla subunit MlaD